MDEILKDERFMHIATDRRFRNMPKSERKFKVDHRFKQMFSNNKFKLKYTVDKRGRPVNMTTDDNLKKFYDLSSSEEEEEKKNEEVKEDLDETDENEENNNKSESEYELSTSDSDSSDDDSDESKSEDEDKLEIPWNELDKDTVRDEAIYSRLAICNMDWDCIKAADLFILLNSFKPPQGVIRSVKIYLSDYGKKRVEYERLHGPEELTATKNNQGTKISSEERLEEQRNSENDNDDEENNNNKDEEKEEGSSYANHKLRQYQFNKLRYYYAIVECDSKETANRIYTECDGLEYESSCSRLDIRMVPDDVKFDDEDESRVHDKCIEAPDPFTYKPNLFFTTALNQTKVECTWDQTSRDRLAATMKHYTENELKDTNNFKNYLATSSEEDEEEEEEVKDSEENKQEKIEDAEDEAETTTTNREEKRINKYKQLLLSLGEQKKKKKYTTGLEFNWEGGMDEECGFDELFNSKKKKNLKRAVETKKELSEEEKQEKAKLDLLLMDNEDNKSHFNLDDLLTDKSKTALKKNAKKYKKNKDQENKDGDSETKQTQDEFKMNLKDPRFEAIFINHKFNIDPSDQLFKSTKAMEALLEEKSKRKLNKIDTETNNELKKQDLDKANQPAKSDISLLVKSIKSKTEVINKNKKLKKST